MRIIHSRRNVLIILPCAWYRGPIDGNEYYLNSAMKFDGKLTSLRKNKNGYETYNLASHVWVIEALW